jgi:Protein of unknown function (DUF3363)
VTEALRRAGAPTGVGLSPDRVSGTLAGSTDLASGRYAMIEDGLGFSLVPWRSILDQRVGQHITGGGDGEIEWDLGRKLGLGL